MPPCRHAAMSPSSTPCSAAQSSLTPESGDGFRVVAVVGQVAQAPAPLLQHACAALVPLHSSRDGLDHNLLPLTPPLVITPRRTEPLVAMAARRGAPGTCSAACAGLCSRLSLPSALFARGEARADARLAACSGRQGGGCGRERSLGGNPRPRARASGTHPLGCVAPYLVLVLAARYEIRECPAAQHLHITHGTPASQCHCSYLNATYEFQ